jgi:hypothetical protein
MCYSVRELLLMALVWFAFGATSCYVVLHFVFHFHF